jgi:mRNA interferase MazF
MFKTGDVVVVRFLGVQKRKPRPMVVISTPLYHHVRPDLILGLCTTNLADAIQPTDYLLQDWQSAGLAKPTAFRSFISTHPVTDIHQHLGTLSDRNWLEVQARLRLAVAV